MLHIPNLLNLTPPLPPQPLPTHSLIHPKTHTLPPSLHLTLILNSPFPFLFLFFSDGGWTEVAYSYVKKAGGIVQDRDYPYTSYLGTTGTCQVKRGFPPLT
ncbi:hypothetical protein EON64_16200, partial [archaeon]